MSVNPKPVKKYSLKERKNLVTLKNFAEIKKGNSIPALLGSFPDVLGARDFKFLVDNISNSVRKGKPVCLAMGAHVIKCGLSPFIISLIENGVINSVSMNGAGAIHDYEISLAGGTSEDVAEGLEEGEFGMSLETAEGLSRGAELGAEKKIGFGMALGKIIEEDKNRYRNMSILAAAARKKIPATIHVALGTDIVHMDPLADGRLIGEASLQDFRIIADHVAKLDGGVWINMGSSVILPEVFLKALTLCRNRGYKVKNFITANIDMISHYRPLTNVVRRPTLKSGKGINLIAQYEILFPLLYFALREKIGFR
ncbi:MAG: hypothetical protein HZA77_00340 [Candidatus Schekmanbacteria bacterium]|nr:hypothetical protein [Candidatus Schekmanbacteria bacterium]